MEACADGDTSVLEEVLKVRHDNEIDINCTDTYGRTLLIWASNKGHAQVVRLLLECEEIQVAKTDNNGSQAIHPATWHSNNVDIIAQLLDKGADVNAKSSDGYTVLLWAIIYGCTSNVQFLLERGADVEWEGKNSSIEKALSLGENSVAEVLQEYKRKEGEKNWYIFIRSLTKKANTIDRSVGSFEVPGIY